MTISYFTQGALGMRLAEIATPLETLAGADETVLDGDWIVEVMENLAREIRALQDVQAAMFQRQCSPSGTPRTRRTVAKQEGALKPSTLAAVVAFVAYNDAGELFEENMSARDFAKRVVKFASEYALEGADLLDEGGTVVRQIASGVLSALRHMRKRQ